MGLVHSEGMIGRSRQEAISVRLLVDTGSFYTAISPDLRRQLDLPAGLPTQVMLADLRIVDAELTVAVLHIDGREAGIPVEIVDVPEPLLGVSALEALGMKVNPLSRELEIVTPFERPPMMTRRHS